MEKTGCKIICGAPTTLAVKELMMMMMMIMMMMMMTSLFFAASCLSVSKFRLVFLIDERHLSQSEVSCCHD